MVRALSAGPSPTDDDDDDDDAMESTRRVGDSTSPSKGSGITLDPGSVSLTRTAIETKQTMTGRKKGKAKKLSRLLSETFQYY